MTDKSHINQVATVIIANVIRRLMRNVDEEYRRGETILSGASLSQETRRIIEEERPVIAALYAIAYDGTAALRLNNGGKPFSFSFVQNKVVQMKPNPYREQTTMLLRELFTDFRAKSGD